MHKKYLNSFVLVGGTALALQLGQRRSDDLDLFTIRDFNSVTIIEKLIQDFNINIRTQLPQTIIAEINDIKVDFIRSNTLLSDQSE
jgi:hypothetical protein